MVFTHTRNHHFCPTSKVRPQDGQSYVGQDRGVALAGGGRFKQGVGDFHFNARYNQLGRTVAGGAQRYM